jgi:hypothetical protein
MKLNTNNIFFILGLIVFQACQKDDLPTKLDIRQGPFVTGKELEFELKGSFNKDTEIRWNFDGDTTWETEFSQEFTANYTYLRASEYNVKIEVRNGAGLIVEYSYPVSISLSSAPIPSKKYYVIAKLDNNEWLFTESNNPETYYDGTSSVSCVWGDPVTHAYLWYLDMGSTPTTAQVLSLKNTTIPFEDIAFMRVAKSVPEYSTSFTNQTGSSVFISDVIPDGQYQNYSSYVLKGTFSCKLSLQGSQGIRQVSQGEFAMRMLVP